MLASALVVFREVLQAALVLVGYVARPARRSQPARLMVAMTLASLLAPSMTPRDAHAGFKVYAPYVEHRELELEYRPSRTVDDDDDKDDEQIHLLGIGYGVTPWWFTEIYSEWEREAGSGEDTGFEAIEWENRFQLTNPGEHWVDFGLLLEYEHTEAGDSPDAIELALLFEKELGRFEATYNLIFAHEVGDDAGSDFEFGDSFQFRYRLHRMFEPAVEFFSEFGPIDDVPSFDDQQHYLGPVAMGVLPLGDFGMKLQYNVGYLFGVTDETADGVIKAIFEFEIPL